MEDLLAPAGCNKPNDCLFRSIISLIYNGMCLNFPDKVLQLVNNEIADVFCQSNKFVSDVRKKCKAITTFPFPQNFPEVKISEHIQ